MDKKKFRWKNMSGEYVYGGLRDAIMRFENNIVAFIPAEESIEQFSGVFDKNGTEIYEGDIVKGMFYHGFDVYGVCCFKNGSFGLKWERGSSEEFNPFTSMCNIQYKVIGNITDNSEILEGEYADDE